VVRTREDGAKGQAVSGVWAFLIVGGLVLYFIERGRRDTEDARRWYDEEKKKAKRATPEE
jgi:hypothetical protein